MKTLMPPLCIMTPHEMGGSTACLPLKATAEGWKEMGREVTEESLSQTLGGLVYYPSFATAPYSEVPQKSQVIGQSGFKLVRYSLTDPRNDCQWVRPDLESMIAIAEREGATRFQGLTILQDVVQIEKQANVWVLGPLQARSLSYDEVCWHYKRILSGHPGCGLEVASHGLVFLDEDGATLLRAPYSSDGLTIDEDQLYELDCDAFHYRYWKGETSKSIRADILSPIIKEIPDLEGILARNNATRIMF